MDINKYITESTLTNLKNFLLKKYPIKNNVNIDIQQQIDDIVAESVLIFLDKVKVETKNELMSRKNAEKAIEKYIFGIATHFIYHHFLNKTKKSKLIEYNSEKFEIMEKKQDDFNDNLENEQEINNKVEKVLEIFESKLDAYQSLLVKTWVENGFRTSTVSKVTKIDRGRIAKDLKNIKKIIWLSYDESDG